MGSERINSRSAGLVDVIGSGEIGAGMEPVDRNGKADTLTGFWLMTCRSCSVSTAIHAVGAGFMFDRIKLQFARKTSNAQSKGQRIDRRAAALGTLEFH
jgi:hypothetical protein